MIDVLLPFYGDPDLLKLSVQSVIRQTSGDWRLVVVDDCHPSGTVGPWLGQLDEPRIEYHRNPANLGANQNYVEALKHARAEHFVMMGADDVMAPRYLELMCATIRNVPQAGVVTCRVDVIDAEGRPHLPLTDRIKRALTPRSVDILVLETERAIRSVLRGNWTYFPALCWRRELVTELGFRPSFNVVQDLALLIDVLRTGSPLVLAPQHAFSYRRHAGSDSALKTLAGGERFAEERAYYQTIESELLRDGRVRAAAEARRRITSRLHSAALLPSSIRSRDIAGVRRLLAHAVSDVFDSV